MHENDNPIPKFFIWSSQVYDTPGPKPNPKLKVKGIDI